MSESPPYTGHVDPGMPAARTLGAVTIRKISVGPMDNNVYLLTCRRSGESLLVDAANEAPRLLALLGDAADHRTLVAIVTTHRHPDHWQALADVARATGAPVLAGADDADHLPIPVERRLADGDRVAFGDASVTVIALRGHTAGSVALRYHDPAGTDHLLTGDSLFPGGPGRTASPADFTSLMDDLESRVFGALPDSTWVYPGHGDDTTLGAERPHLAEWRERGW